METFATYTFDTRNRLQNVGGVTNAYDPAGNRVGITYGTNSVSYIVNPNATLSQVLNADKKRGDKLLRLRTGTALSSHRDRDGDKYPEHNHYDYRGSTVALSADNGNVTDRIEYSLYGLTTYRTGTNDNSVSIQRTVWRNDRSQWATLHARPVLQSVSLPVPKS